jgi:hypothetical protein
LLPRTDIPYELGDLEVERRAPVIAGDLYPFEESTFPETVSNTEREPNQLKNSYLAPSQQNISCNIE